jgi:hypothetical protein
MVFVAHHQSPEILQPGTQALHLPPATVTAEGAPVLSGRLPAVGSVRRNHFNPHGGQWCVQRVAVVRLIADQPFGELGGKDLNKRVWDKGDFMWRSSRRVDGERKTSAVCHRHELRTLAPLGRSHPWPPFFATTNVPSRTHCWKRRWQVW